MPDQTPVKVEILLADEEWVEVSWRDGEKGELSAKFAKALIKVAEVRSVNFNGRVYKLPEKEMLAVGEWRDDGTFKYHLSNLTSHTYLFKLTSKLKVRWACELGHVIRSGIPWRLLPEEFGNFKCVHSRYMRWARKVFGSGFLK